MANGTTVGTINDDQLSAIVQLANMLNDGLLVSHIAGGLTCGEVETVADFLRAFGHPEMADEWISHHAESDDDESDLHYAA